MTIKSRSILGRGPSFPYNRSENGGLAYSDDIQRINQSLFLIFETPKGSRLMMPEFGSDIHRYKFDPLDNILMEKLRYTMKEDIRKWEPRISSATIEFLADNHNIENSTLYVLITYHISNTSITANYVYPYQRSTYDTLDISYK